MPTQALTELPIRLFTCYSIFEMAKFLPVGGSLDPQVSGGLLLTQIPSGIYGMQKPNNNRRNIGTGMGKRAKNDSPGFAGLDQQITHLDATFEQIPTQASWNHWAATIDGDWDLCANCSPGTTGKKLFRQVNFNRTLLGLPQTITPPRTTSFDGQISMECVLETSNTGGANTLFVGAFGIFPVWSVFNVGLSMKNPRIYFLVNPSGFYTSGTPTYDQLAPIVQQALGKPGTAGSITICNFDYDGTPGHTGNGDFSWGGS